MNARKKNRRRLVRALALAGSVTALAVPAGAAAMPVGPDSSSVAQDNAPAADQTGARLDHRGLNDAATTYTLPSGFSTDTQSAARPGAADTSVTYTLPAGFQSDVQSAPPTATPTSSPTSIVREIHTVVDNGNRTLAIVLAASALGIALCGTGYAVVRLTQIQRRAVGSSS